MKALRDVFGDTLVSLGSSNPNVVVLDADLANSTKADKFAKMYPGRFLQMGIAEQNFVGVAVGLASLGYVRTADGTYGQDAPRCPGSGNYACDARHDGRGSSRRH